ncbi:hypothetical protein SAMN04488689_110139 [Paenibacillus sp. cl6col]|nr:hypothetical protein SAMN04488689_110139 [Paenibacillus sp. cl6col]
MFGVNRIFNNYWMKKKHRSEKLLCFFFYIFIGNAFHFRAQCSFHPIIEAILKVRNL